MSAAAVGAMTLYRSSIGKKIIMAVTGVIWIGYVFMHMYGNLKIFLGAAYFNEYAEGLRELGHPVFGHLHLLTIARVVLVVSIIAHVWAAVMLTRRAQAARPQKYAVKKSVQADSASLYIRWGGVMIFLFIIYHLAHLTWGTPGVHPDYVRGDPYANVIVGFQSVPTVFFYLLALVALAFHLYHGAWSMFQTLGLSNQGIRPALRGLAVVLAIAVPVGFALVPLAILFGFVTL